jgi:hypothetical protein
MTKQRPRFYGRLFPFSDTPLFDRANLGVLKVQCTPRAWDNPPPWDSVQCGLKACPIS